MEGYHLGESRCPHRVYSVAINQAEAGLGRRGLPVTEPRNSHLYILYDVAVRTIEVGMRVVVTDHRFPSVEAERELVRSAGGELVVIQSTVESDLVAACRDAAVILAARASISRPILESATSCRAVIRYGIGYDNVDVDAATKLGIMVANVPDYCVEEVADHTLTLLLALARRLEQATALARRPKWQINEMDQVQRLRGQTLGLIGFGRIGRALAARVQPLGIRVISHDPGVDPEVAAGAGVRLAAFDAVLEESDFLSLHLPLTPETHHIIGKAAIAQMKRSAIIINTSRGGLVDESTVIDAILAGQLGGAGLDVLEVEPPPPHHELQNHPSILVTAHVAWYSEQAREELQRKAGEQAAAVLRGERPYALVNQSVVPRDTVAS